jgi:hypothetical protein
MEYRKKIGEYKKYNIDRKYEPKDYNIHINHKTDINIDTTIVILGGSVITVFGVVSQAIGEKIYKCGKNVISFFDNLVVTPKNDIPENQLIIKKKMKNKKNHLLLSQQLLELYFLHHLKQI